VDDAGLTAFSFGEEEVDRHLIVWKREFAPCDDELVVIRNGGEWTEEKGVEIKRKRQVGSLRSSNVHLKPVRKLPGKNRYIIVIVIGFHFLQRLGSQS